jgi:VanZ family protein
LTAAHNLTPALRTLARALAWSLATAIVVLSVVPPTLRPETTLPHDLEHVTIFWATGIAFALGYSLTPLLASALVVFSGGVEIVQMFMPGRHARLSDFIVDALASVIGLITVSLVTQMRNRTRA